MTIDRWGARLELGGHWSLARELSQSRATALKPHSSLAPQLEVWSRQWVRGKLLRQPPRRQLVSAARPLTSADKRCCCMVDVRALVPATPMRVVDLTPDSSGLQLVVQVLGCDVIVERVRFDGSSVRVGDVTVGDSSGLVKLLALNEQLDSLLVGQTVRLCNARVALHRGQMRLEVDATGAIVHLENVRLDSINTSENVSDVSYVRIG